MKSKFAFHNLWVLLFSFSFISVVKGQNNSLQIENKGFSCIDYNYVDIGDLSITGKNLTVEAIIQTSSNGDCHMSPHHDVVSKHYDNRDVNYLLRPGYATINTENGFFQTNPFTVTNNECHHIAMTYDGLYLRFYFDGVVDSVSATGNLITNPLHTLIGYSAGFNPNWFTQYFGLIDEVRIWNVTRTKQQIRDYAYTTITDPHKQSGLIAYYDFQSGYENKAGNVNYNGVQRGNVVLASDSISCVSDNLPVDSNKVIMYPNPLNKYGTIRFNVELTNAGISIYDVLGKKLNIIREISGNEVRIETKYLANGIYYVALKQENNSISIFKLIVYY